MMAQKGWYPDPGGQAGMFRYWDGGSWSQTLSPTPLPGPPATLPAPAPPGQASFGGSGTDAQTTGQPGHGAAPGSQPLVVGQSAHRGYGAHQPSGPYQPSSLYQPAPGPAPAKNRGAALWIGIISAVVVLALAVYFVPKLFTGGGDGGGGNSGGNPTSAPCPKSPTENVRASHPSGDGRVYGGKLSYPMLSAPWEPPRTEMKPTLPFGRDVAEQLITIHPNYSKDGSWVISVIVGELYAGDGFYDPEEGSQIVNRCIFGTFYGNAKVTSDVKRSERYTLDGFDGWITETNLSFSIPNLATTSELAIVIIVKTSAESSSIFYASIPNDAVQYRPDVDKAMAGLHVVT